MLQLVSKRMRRERGDRGMTLVETLIAAILLIIVIGLSTGSMMFALGKQSNISQSTDAATQTQNGVELLGRVIRQGVYPTGSSKNSSIIQTATATQLVVTSRLSNSYSITASQMNTQVRQYTFTLTGTTLYWQQADLVSCTGAGVCTYGTPTAQKVLIKGVRNTSGASACSGNTSWSDGPFHYVTQDATTGVPNAAAAPITGATNLNLIGYVQLNFFTQTQTGTQAPACVPLSDYVQLRNKA